MAACGGILSVIMTPMLLNGRFNWKFGLSKTTYECAQRLMSTVFAGIYCMRDYVE